jgi:hypothetical protein
VTKHGAFITHGYRSEIREYDAGGRLLRILRVDGEARPVTAGMIEAKVGQNNLLYPGGDWARLFDEMPIPTTLPDYQTLRLDETGWLWAEEFTWDPTQPSKWTVFDPEGRAKGVVVLPQRLEVLWIGRDAILGVWRDEFDVEYLHGYRLERD